MQLTDRQWQLFDFVKEMHGSQLRKYSGKPYYTHLLSVAGRVDEYVKQDCLKEIALCHDLIEDTPCSLADLSAELMRLGYNVNEDAQILAGVDALTDKFIPSRYPHLNRKKRKDLEATRITRTSSVAQTVKYADIIDNITTIIEEDRGFASIYLREIAAYIWQIDKGEAELYAECCRVFIQVSRQLGLEEQHTTVNF
jgi:guanosine-3',5'-bis(diphosphate) 3'-pyrophosphohydrolase